MPLLATAEGELDHLVTGSGRPVTVFAHGLAGSVAETRPLGSGVHGTRVFLHFRGHGASRARHDEWSYAALARELRAVADHVGASRALGVSLGAGALTHLVAEAPDRFDRLVFFLPAALDLPRPESQQRRLETMAQLVDRCDVAGLAALLRADQPAGVRDRPDVAAWARRRAVALAGTAVAGALRGLAAEVPLADADVLARVTAPALVVAQRGDEVHPVAAAERLAAALPHSRLHVFDDGGALWSARHELRALVAGFLNRR